MDVFVCWGLLGVVGSVCFVLLGQFVLLNQFGSLYGLFSVKRNILKRWCVCMLSSGVKVCLNGCQLTQAISCRV